MKRAAIPAVIIIILLSCSLVFPSAADSVTWTQQNKGTRTLWGVQFIDSLQGWACGDYGTLYRTTSGGANWLQSSVGSTDSLSSLFFLNCSTGFAGSGTGRIYKSTDSGRTWTQNYYRLGYITEIKFWNKDTGWAPGGAKRGVVSAWDPVMYRTRNGGVTWDSIPVPRPFGLSFVSSPDGAHVFTGGSDYLAASSNWGTTWSPAVDFLTMTDSVFKATNGYINTADFQSPLRGLAVGRYGHILRTADGGVSWVTARPNDYVWLEDVAYTDSSRAVIAGERGAVLSSADAGYSWTKRYPRHLSTTDAPWWRALFCLDAQHVWMVGDSGLIMKGRFNDLGTSISVKPVQMTGDLPMLEATPSSGTGIFVRYNLTNPARVVLTLNDLSGRSVARLDLGSRNSGGGTLEWRPRGMAGSGIYLMRMTLDGNAVRAARVIHIR